jgi:hypothetical protein
MRRWEKASVVLMVVSLVVVVPWGVRNVLLVIARDGWSPVIRMALGSALVGVGIYCSMRSATRRR